MGKGLWNSSSNNLGMSFAGSSFRSGGDYLSLPSGIEYDRPQKRGGSYVGEVLSFGELMLEFDTDEDLLAFVKRVLRNRQLEIQSDDDLISAELVKLLREMLNSRRKQTEPLEEGKTRIYLKKA